MKHLIKIWAVGNTSSSLVSEIKNMSMLLSIINFSTSNLSRIKLIFMWPEISLSDDWAFHFLKPKICGKDSYFRQWRQRFLEDIKIAQSSQNRFIFYNWTRSFGFNLKIYRMTSWEWGSVKKESFLRKKKQNTCPIYKILAQYSFSCI